ncbi:unnamed protein product, partial [marine sediment metagenome]
KLRGLIWVMRKYPKKLKPPYSDLQAEAQAVFAIASSSMPRLSEHIKEAWRLNAVGKTESWTDTYRRIIMGYWKLYRVVAPIALNYHINETETDYQVIWNILQLYIVPGIQEEVYDMQTSLILKSDLQNTPRPIYFTLLLDGKIRLVAPYILFDVT